ILAILALSLVFIACPTEGGGGSSGGKTIDDIVIPVIQEDFFVIDGEFDLDALLLELEDFEITINYSDGTSTTVGIGDCTISGFDPDVEGEQEITVSYGGSSGKSITFTVYVYSADNFVAVEGVSLNKTAVTIEAGGSETLAAVFDPEDATEKRVRWTSDNPALAAVNAYGVINVPEDAEEGTVTITVTTIDRGLTATCVVTVTTDGEPVQNLENLTVGLTAGDGKVTLAPQTAAAGFAFYYNKSDASVAAPAYGDAITTIIGATAYTTATDITGANETAIYVQVYKVETTGNTIVGFGQANRTPTATPDTAAPVPGNSGAITTADVTQNSLTLNWAKATDDITAPANLLYFVYQKDSAFTMSAGLPTDGNLLNAGGTADIATYNVTGLSAVTSYYFIVVVEDEAGNRAAYTAVSETTAATLTYEISASTLTSFGSLVTPYTQPTAQTVIITNTGTGTVMLNQPTSTNYDIGTLSATAIAAGETATFTVQPKAGLAEGNHNETINITGSNDAETSVDAEFTVLTPKTVSVGMQSGTLSAGVAGTVTFPVTTANIANGSYTATVANLPEGVTVQGQVTIDSNSGTLTLAGNTSTAAGTTSNLTLTIDGTTSGNFELSIAAAPKAVSVGEQSGPLTAATAGSVTFAVTTVSIGNSFSVGDGQVSWFSDPEGTTAESRPSGITVTGTPTNNNASTITMTATTATVAGTYYFKVTIDSTTSAVATLIIGVAVKSVGVETQTGTMTEGVAGSVTYKVNTSGIANGTYPATVANRPTGVTVGDSGNVTLSAGTGTLTLTGDTTTTAGLSTNLTLTLDGVTSGAFSLNIIEAKPFEGEGTEDQPYLIGTAAQLVNLGALMRAGDSAYYNKVYKLTAPIDLDVAPYNSDKGWIPVGNFRGVFDGDGKTISGLFINDDERYSAGLFSDINYGSVVKNLTLTSVNITAQNGSNSYVGGVAGHVYSGNSIINCTVSGNINGGTRVGGVAGYLQINSSIADCSSSAAVSGNNRVGGVVGDISSGCSIANSSSTGTISGYQAVGGVVGFNEGTVTNCSYTTGSVSGYAMAGGIAGTSYNAITGCYSTGAVSATNGGVGGIAGSVYGSVSNCYAAGSVSANSSSNAGGIAGTVFDNVSISNCYTTGAVSGNNNIGGIAGVMLTGSSTVNCFALNPTVKGSSDVGRILGYFEGGTLSGNYAYSGMGTDGGTDFGTDRGESHPNGVDISATAATTQSTYSTSVPAQNFTGWSFGSSDASPWDWGGSSYPLPVLYWQSGTPTLPGHLE
ncbi:MAG: Ig-like domain-containing protein, partial [Treponema sp.]|nr:Ig-like domain-containing protein [Treponema sp.]